MRKKQTSHRGLQWAATLFFVLPAQGQSTKRYPLETHMVADALRLHGLTVNEAQISMPTHITTAGLAPELKVIQAGRTPDGKLRVQVRCARLGECVSFLVLLTLPEQASTEFVKVSRAERDTALPLPELVQTASDRTADTIPDIQPLLRAGQTLVLWINQGRLQIHIPVIALEPGARGQLIRVATADRKTEFRALVVDNGNAKGETE